MVVGTSRFPAAGGNREAMVRVISWIVIAVLVCSILMFSSLFLHTYFMYKGIDKLARIFLALFITSAFTFPCLLHTWLQYRIVLHEDFYGLTDAHNVNMAADVPYRGIDEEVHAMRHNLNTMKGDISVIKEIYTSIKSAISSNRRALTSTNGTCTSSKQDMDEMKEDIDVMKQSMKALIGVLSIDEINKAKTLPQTRGEELQNPTNKMKNVDHIV